MAKLRSFLISGGYGYDGGAFLPDEPPTGGGGYGYSGYWYGENRAAELKVVKR
jgi:hypothetical protein